MPRAVDPFYGRKTSGVPHAPPSSLQIICKDASRPKYRNLGK